ncbi:MAG: dihydropteroate synthase [Burkholderiales bacterium]
MLPLDRPLVVGIVNVTPDSFFDGGRFFDERMACQHVQRLLDEGADILDVGGESSRPGATRIGAQEELRRVMPILEKFAAGTVPVSVDTCKPEVMARVLAAGASMINDITALRAPGALEAVAASQAAVCLMHMQGEPDNMQKQPVYDDVVKEVLAFLSQRIDAVMAAGIPASRIVADPGFGFGKSVEHNLALLRRLREFGQLGVPVYVGLSRKSMLQRLTGRGTAERLPGSLALAMVAMQNGARLVRTHDVAATRDALAVLQATGDGAP